MGREQPKLRSKLLKGSPKLESNQFGNSIKKSIRKKRNFHRGRPS